LVPEIPFPSGSQKSYAVDEASNPPDAVREPVSLISVGIPDGFR
jgi:hypothetical protein